ncbi:MAG: MFS transporter [Pseudonocardia sp.]|nr:MFS transporter [Pseudonocardia sp.]
MRRTIAPNPWVVLGLLTGFWGLVGLNRIGITYLFPVIVPEFHMAYWQASLLISGTSFAWAFSSWLSGWLSDHYGRRRVLLPGAAVAVVSTAAMGGAWNFWSMFVIRDVVGIGDGVGWPNAQAVLATEFPAKRRALVQAIFTSGYTLFGSVLGALIVTRLAATLGWRPVFPIISAVFLLVVIGLYFFLREPERTAVKATARPQWWDAIKVVRNRTVLLLVIVQAGALSWLQVAVGFNSLFLSRVRHIDLVTIGTVTAIMGVASLVGTLVLPYVSDFVGRKPAICVAGLLSAACLALYVLGDFGLGVSTFLLAASGFFYAVIIPLAAATCVVESVPADVQATAMGAINFGGVIIGTFLMPILGGVLADQIGLSSPMLLAAGAVAVSGLVILGIPETAPRLLERRQAAAAGMPAD